MTTKSMTKVWPSRIGRMVILGLVVMGTSLPATAGSTFEDDVLLVNCGSFPGHATRRYRIETNNRRRVRIEVSNAPDGGYRVIIAGVDRGAFSVVAGIGQIEFDTRPDVGELPLTFPFDVNTEVDVFYGMSRLAYSKTDDDACMNASGPPVSTSSSSSSSSSTSSTSSTSTTLDSSSSTSATSTSETSTSTSSTSTTLQSCQATENTVSLVNCGPIRGGTGTRRFRVHLDCERDVRYKIGKVPNGTYSVYVTDVDGSLKRGTITATLHQGELEFDDTPAVNEVLLTFNPLGNVIIKRDSTGEKVFGYPSCQ